MRCEASMGNILEHWNGNIVQRQYNTIITLTGTEPHSVVTLGPFNKNITLESKYDLDDETSYTLPTLWYIFIYVVYYIIFCCREPRDQSPRQTSYKDASHSISHPPSRLVFSSTYTYLLSLSLSLSLRPAI